MRIEDVLRRGSHQFGDSPCVSCISGSDVVYLAFRDAWDTLGDHQQWLDNTMQSHNLGGTPENSSSLVVAYLSSNSADMMISMLASTGLVSNGDNNDKVALLNTRWTTLEMEAVLQTTSRPNIRMLILYSAEFQEQAQQLQSMLHHTSFCMQIPCFTRKRLTTTIITFPPGTNPYKSHKLLNHCEANENVDAQIALTSSMADDNDALIIFTSGTTSGSKGVRLSHRALLVQAWAKLQDPCQYTNKTNMLSTTVPLFHVGGLSSLLALWLAGGLWIVPPRSEHSSGTTNSKFSPQTVFETLSHKIKPVNTLVVVPAMIHAMLQHREKMKDSRVYENLNLMLIGGQSVSSNQIAQLGIVFVRWCSTPLI